MVAPQIFLVQPVPAKDIFTLRVPSGFALNERGLHDEDRPVGLWATEEFGRSLIQRASENGRVVHKSLVGRVKPPHSNTVRPSFILYRANGSSSQLDITHRRGDAVSYICNLVLRMQDYGITQVTPQQLANFGLQIRPPV